MHPALSAVGIVVQGHALRACVALPEKLTERCYFVFKVDVVAFPVEKRE